MFRRRSLMFLLGATVLVAGCERDATSPLIAPDEPAARWVDGEKMVPISWSFHVWAVGEETVTCYFPAGPPYYGAPLAEVEATYAVSGTVSHLGRLDEEVSLATIHDCTVGLNADFAPVTVYGHATARLVGPQKDEIHLDGTLTQYFSGPEPYAAGDWDIVDGAGRFLGASGWLHTIEYPADEGSTGSGSGMVTQPAPSGGPR